jgi:hypothetical protein
MRNWIVIVYLKGVLKRKENIHANPLLSLPQAVCYGQRGCPPGFARDDCRRLRPS